MKITVVCDRFGADNNGEADVALRLVRAMKQRGHEVAVVCADEARDGKEGFVVVSRLAGVVSMKSAFAREDKKKLEEAVWDSDVVHIMTPFALGAAAVKLCRKHLIPASADFRLQAESITSRFNLRDSRAASRLTYRQLYNALYRHADAVRYPAGFAREVFENAVGKSTNAYIIPDGVDERFHPGAAEKPSEFRNQFVILYCAPYTREKSHRVLIDAVALSKHSSRIRLILAGEGPLKNALRTRSSKLPVKPILANYPRIQMPKLYRYADLYVHPAQVEAQAQAVMEALACGTVPFAADSPLSAASRLVPDPELLFKCGDARDLAERIDRIIELPELLEMYRERCMGVAVEFSEDACMDRVEEMLYDVWK
ncbi:MAG: glycosyltransferase [Ruminococcus sp.]|nr:glycosyltransferase [Ruminococcus sp.]